MTGIGDITWPLFILGGAYYFRNEIKSAFAKVRVRKHTLRNGQTFYNVTCE